VACTQILVNLLTNAIKFTPKGGSVGLETQTGPNGQLQIVVWDTGIGIPPEEQAKIFRSSYRVQPATGGHAAPGHGFGLAISRDLARAMDGDLTVSSQPGQGSRFILSLPLAGS
jgi:signal transduction histidine kinase